ncbi:MAG: hypothetical protein E7I42_28025, partial [Pluralibacter gergoviae]|nr:hypothetical protein [Pluralibacter gergoviae]
VTTLKHGSSIQRIWAKASMVKHPPALKEAASCRSKKFFCRSLLTASAKNFQTKIFIFHFAIELTLLNLSI